jgi:hypothetical protein
MNRCFTILLGLTAAVAPVMAQTSAVQVPKTSFRRQQFLDRDYRLWGCHAVHRGSGRGVQRKVQLGGPVEFGASDITTAGHYSVFVVSSSSTESAQFDVTASKRSGVDQFSGEAFAAAG